MKRIITCLILTLALTSCQAPTYLKLDSNSVKEYSELNNYLLKSEKAFGYIKDPENLKDQNAREIFERLKSENKLISISYDKSDLIFYKMKHEKVEPFLGLGLHFFSHYLIYTNAKSPNFGRIFNDDFELEERYYRSDEINENWYYVIGEYFSD